jgi:hypothetical protein
MADESNKRPNGEVVDPAALVVAVRQVDRLIGRGLRELEELVKLREQLTGEDLLGDRQRGRDRIERERAAMRARDPEGWARAHVWAKGVMKRVSRERAELTAGPGAEVRLAVDVVGQWRQVRRDESQRESERVRRLLAERGQPDADGGQAATGA